MNYIRAMQVTINKKRFYFTPQDVAAIKALPVSDRADEQHTLKIGKQIYSISNYGGGVFFITVYSKTMRMNLPVGSFKF